LAGGLSTFWKGHSVLAFNAGDARFLDAGYYQLAQTWNASAWGRQWGYSDKKVP